MQSCLAHAKGAKVKKKTKGKGKRGPDDVVTDNDLHHIFDKEEHLLSDIVERHGGQQSAFDAIRGATEREVRAQGIPDGFIYETTVRLGDDSLRVRGAIVDGIPRISTAFRATK